MSSLFSKNFKYLRKKRNISQSELANQLSISRSKIASYEGRGVEPKLSLLVEISKFFDVSVKDMIGTDIEESINRAGANSIQPFESKAENVNKNKALEGVYLNIHHDDALDKFLKESATVVKMLEGFKVFYKIKTEGQPTEELSPEVQKAQHDIQNVLFLIDYLLQHNKDLITVLKNAEAA